MIIKEKEIFKLRNSANTKLEGYELVINFYWKLEECFQPLEDCISKMLFWKKGEGEKNKDRIVW